MIKLLYLIYYSNVNHAKINVNYRHLLQNNKHRDNLLKSSGHPIHIQNNVPCCFAK